ncbi:GtrA family protein [Blastococcus xanthinilyticus]|uniref:GtrA family protein n=1 Tax=Blastococcus xanthinilyticus TaxID=1564164 RepID=UPI001412D9B7
MPTLSSLVQHGSALAAAARWSPGAGWQFSRFVFVGAVSSALYAALFLTLAGTDAQLANLVASIASAALANELHRLVTFRAGRQITRLAAQVRGGGLSVIALVATSASLAAANRLVGDTTALQQLLLIGAVTGAIGASRFVALRLLVFRHRSPMPQHDGAPRITAAAMAHGSSSSTESVHLPFTVRILGQQPDERQPPRREAQLPGQRPGGRVPVVVALQRPAGEAQRVVPDVALAERAHRADQRAPTEGRRCRRRVPGRPAGAGRRRRRGQWS